MKHMLLIFSTISLLFISAHAADVSPRYKLFSFNKVTGLPETNDNFFRVIIDNNIFRPLGWRASPPPFPYRLLATLTHAGGKKTPAAIIEETSAPHKKHFVTIGDTLGETTISHIQKKQVTLETAGKKITLTLSLQFLNPRPARHPSMKTHTHKEPLPLQLKNVPTDKTPPQRGEYIPPKIIRVVDFR